jgi:hypothetical protein
MARFRDVLPRVVVLVEGMSDRCALETLAHRRGRDLVNERVVVRATDGATNIRRALDALGASSPGTRPVGLCDAGEERYLRQGLKYAGFGTGLDRAGLEELDFFVCVDDLEVRRVVMDLEAVAASGGGGVETLAEGSSTHPTVLPG